MSQEPTCFWWIHHKRPGRPCWKIELQDIEEQLGGCWWLKGTLKKTLFVDATWTAGTFFGQILLPVHPILLSKSQLGGSKSLMLREVLLDRGRSSNWQRNNSAAVVFSKIEMVGFDCLATPAPNPSIDSLLVLTSQLPPCFAALPTSGRLYIAWAKAAQSFVVSCDSASTFGDHPG